MNERIKEIALQAGGSHYPEVNTMQLEKFADMLIRECIQQVVLQYKPVLENEDMMKDTHWDGYVQCGVDCHAAIREHFGIKQ
jgi:hypothetical protein